MSYDYPDDFDWDAFWIKETIECLSKNMEAAATCAALYRLGYTKGFSDGTTLREFCEDYVPEPYYPSADSRPTAERLAWRE